MSDYDVVVIGAGSNGLVVAGYLAKAGLKVLVLERMKKVGGMAGTEEPLPGYRINSGAVFMGGLRPEVEKDLELKKFGLRDTTLDPQSFDPFPENKYLVMWTDRDKTAKEISRLSEKDAKAWYDYTDWWGQMSELVDPLLMNSSPKLSDLTTLFSDPESEDALRRMFMSSKDFLDQYFESEELKGILAWTGSDSRRGGPYMAGTAWTLGVAFFLWHAFRAPLGGMGTITQAMANAANHFGVKIMTDSPVKRILIENKTAVGVELHDGSKIRSRIVISNAEAKTTFLKLVESGHLEDRFIKQISNFKTDGMSTKIVFALNELPSFTALPSKGKGIQHVSFHIVPSADALERAWDEAKFGVPSKHPCSYNCFTTTADPSLAPPGKYILDSFFQYTPYHLAGKKTWDDIKEDFAQTAIQSISEYAPGFEKSIEHMWITTPLDMERKFGATGGCTYHGEMTLEQMLSFRPIPQCSDYRTPIKNLYLSSASCHPGGGVTGMPGHNASELILEDWKSAKI